MSSAPSRLKGIREKTGFFDSFPTSLKTKLIKTGLVFLAIVATAPIGVVASNATIDSEIKTMAKQSASFEDLLSKVDEKMKNDAFFMVQNNVSTAVNAGWAKIAEWAGDDKESKKIASLDVAHHYAQNHKADLDLKDFQTPCSPEEFQQQINEANEVASRTGILFETECEIKQDWFNANKANQSESSNKIKI